MNGATSGILVEFKFVVCQPGGQWYETRTSAVVASDSLQGVSDADRAAARQTLMTELNAEGQASAYVLHAGEARSEDLSELIGEVLEDETLEARVHQGVPTEDLARTLAEGGPYTAQAWAEAIRLGMVSLGEMDFYLVRGSLGTHYVIARSAADAEDRCFALTGERAALPTLRVASDSAPVLGSFER